MVTWVNAILKMVDNREDQVDILFAQCRTVKGIIMEFTLKGTWLTLRLGERKWRVSLLDPPRDKGGCRIIHFFVG